MAGLALTLAACASPSVPTPEPQAQPPSVPEVPQAAETGDLPEETLPEVAEEEVIGHQQVKVGLLLPLSGARADVGQAILNAAQLALFDLAGDRFALVIRDTGGTPQGAAAAAQAALDEGAELILGPLFSTSAEAVKPVAAAAAVPMITFSNNTAIAGPETFVMGVTPSTQVNRVIDYAVAQGLRRFAVLAPENEYGNVVVRALQEAVFRNGVELSRVVYYDPRATDVSAEVQVLADFNQRRAAAEAQRRDLEGRSDEAAQRALQRLQGVETVGLLPFDAILLPASGQQLLSVAPLLAYYDVDPAEVRFLGTALWEDPTLLREPTLQGGWFPAPPPALWNTFRKRYEDSFGNTPPRVASLGYDAVALAAVLEQRTGAGGSFLPYTAETITQALGFAGIDGIFRFLPGGTVQRGLAVLEIRQAGFVERDPAPRSFPAGIN
ncbi:penicillin-binding protein activator [Pelagibius marinus]|uniref:penicillin-binding protein activator n=1 Tax=Pelagibius marinus TaxID=2762760 RepID=UPI001872C0A3|nr:penicillin-binding protein activator [Pelagibius marinus]